LTSLSIIAATEWLLLLLLLLLALTACWWLGLSCCAGLLLQPS
jgi:hypothetical protein